MATSRILLISDAGDTVVVDALRGAAHETTVATDVASALEAAEGTTAEVIVLDLGGSAADLVEASQAIKASPALAGLPILCVSQTDDVEDRILLLEAGADDVIARPFDARELDARAEALALRLHRSRDLGAVASTGGITIRDSSQRRIIAVYSPKGGVGTTTVAVNIATWLAGQLPGAVAILDLDFQFGQVSTHLNIETRMTMAELVRDEATLRDPGLFAAALDRHGSGLMVLGAPASPDVVSGVTAEALATLLATASAAFQVVVIDAGSVLDARSETVLTHATDIVVVVTPEFPALKAVHALGEILNLSGGELGETSYVLNEVFARELLRLSHIEEALGTKVALTIPYDAFAFLKSVNEGVPLVEGSPKTPAAEQLRRLAARVAGLPSAASAPVERKARGLGSLFSRS